MSRRDRSRSGVQFVVTGKRPVINYTVQRAADGGTNVAVNSEDKAGAVTVSGAHDDAIGNQVAGGANFSVVGNHRASGARSSVAGGQAVRAGRDAVPARQDAAVPCAGEQPVKEGWWARLRKRARSSRSPQSSASPRSSSPYWSRLAGNREWLGIIWSP